MTPQWSAESVGPGVVARRVAEGSPADRAGLQVGDRVVAWRSKSATDPDVNTGDWRSVASPFELIEVERESLASERVELRVEHPDGPRLVLLTAGAWGVTWRPAWGRAFADEVARQVSALVAESPSQEDGSPAKTEPLMTRPAALQEFLAAAGASSVEEAWLWRTVVVDRPGLLTAGLLEAAQGALEVAAPGLRRPNRSEAGLLIDAAAAAYRRQQIDQVEVVLGEAESWFVGEPEDGAEHLWAEYHRLRGDLELYAGDVAAADDHFALCLEVLEGIGGSRFEARCLARQGQSAIEGGDLERAERLLGRALPMALERAPNQLEEALVRNSNAVLALRRGRAEAARDELVQVYEIYRGMQDHRIAAAFVLFNLGVAAAEAGEIAEAERRYLEALDSLGEEQAPDRFLASLYNNLSNLVRVRGEFSRALEFAEKNLTLRSKLAPRTPVEILGQITLAGTLRQLGELERSRRLLEAAAGTAAEVAPESFWHSLALGILGETLLDLGESSAALDVLAPAVALYERLGVGAMTVAVARYHQALAWIAEGELDRALLASRRAVETFEAEEVATNHYAFARYVLGLALWRSGEPAAARSEFERALAINEQQALYLDSDERGTEQFRRRLLPVYLDLAEVLLELDQADRAFETIERSRARSLVAMLGSRDVALDGRLDADLRRDYREAVRAYEEVRRGAAGADRSDLRWARRREEAERALDRVEERIRQQEPELVALIDPRPLPYVDLASLLDEGTVLLCYVVRERHTLLFVVRSQGRPGVHRLPVGHAELASRVEVLQTLLRSGGSPLADLDGLQAVAEELGEVLLGPVRQEVELAERIALSVDGPLLALAWPALRLGTHGGAGPGTTEAEYLIERLPIHLVPSLTAFQALRGDRAMGSRVGPVSTVSAVSTGSDGSTVSSAGRSMVFADPPVPAADGFGLERGAGGPRALPGARAEAEAIRRNLGPSAEVFLGRAATEKQLEDLPDVLEVLHFASHAEARPYEPLESALLLAAGGGHDGVLHAWEILQRLRVTVDLVALSGCETDVGQVIAGEGLIGLTRAFQYAGARSVLASQWLVDDRSTADLMALFYQHLSQGVSKDEALRRAQVELVSGLAEQRPGGWWSRLFQSQSEAPRSTVHPYHWAGFQLTGDWR